MPIAAGRFSFWMEGPAPERPEAVKDAPLLGAGKRSRGPRLRPALADRSLPRKSNLGAPSNLREHSTRPSPGTERSLAYQPPTALVGYPSSGPNRPPPTP